MCHIVIYVRLPIYFVQQTKLGGKNYKHCAKSMKIPRCSSEMRTPRPRAKHKNRCRHLLTEIVAIPPYPILAVNKFNVRWSTCRILKKRVEAERGGVVRAVLLSPSPLFPTSNLSAEVWESVVFLLCRQFMTFSFFFSYFFSWASPVRVFLFLYFLWPLFFFILVKMAHRGLLRFFAPVIM